ncbi:MAG: aminopeptidase P family protein [Actinomycetales bacterium]|nr:aminopeptidase P family protein [Actinomycetales bacterium]
MSNESSQSGDSDASAEADAHDASGNRRPHAGRRARARKLLQERAGGDTGWLLVTSLPNIAYLTGFSGSNAVLALHAQDPDRDLLGTDGRYAEQARIQAPGLPTLIDRSTLPAIVSAVAAGRGSLMVESCLAVADHQAVQERVRGPVTPLVGLVEELRIIKDAAEIAALMAACAITSAAFEQLFDEVRPGMTEIAIARRLEQLFGEMGASDRAFETIVGSGPNSAIPHHRCGQRAIEPGDLLVVDAGALVDGYHADMTRTAVVARQPADWQAEIHGIVLDGQTRARASAVDGMALARLDTAARQPIADAGYGEAFAHGLGHGVGLEIHEAPMIGTRSTGSLGVGMPVTIEPGIYLPGRGGVRIEDTLVVESSGPRVLTAMSRELRTVG